MEIGRWFCLVLMFCVGLWSIKRLFRWDEKTYEHWDNTSYYPALIASIEAGFWHNFFTILNSWIIYWKRMFIYWSICMSTFLIHLKGKKNTKELLSSLSTATAAAAAPMATSDQITHSVQLIKSNDIDAKLDFYRSKNRFLFTIQAHIYFAQPIWLIAIVYTIRSIAERSLFYRFGNMFYARLCIFHANFVNISSMCVNVCVLDIRDAQKIALPTFFSVLFYFIIFAMHFKLYVLYTRIIIYGDIDISIVYFFDFDGNISLRFFFALFNVALPFRSKFSFFCPFSLNFATVQSVRFFIDSHIFLKLL